MSRIGKKPIPVPAGVSVAVNDKTRTLTVEGPKGKLDYAWHETVDVAMDEDGKNVVCSVADESDRVLRAMWGTTRSRIANNVVGVKDGYTIKLQIIGVGWNAKPAGKNILLNIGYCHPVELTPPAGVEFAVERDMVTITGPDKHAVGQFAANIRSKRPPEPYNGKGIKYLDEIIIRKQGKVFGA
ncbi:MAG: 50S ribosomal protein L6 [Planctomycetota bacterium]|jgi:large subunit ribosomal protein L6